jgi:type I restriction enzyme S subunit
MNKKDLFKKTEIGLIPEDWERKANYSISEIIVGQFPPPSSYNGTGDGSHLYQGKDLKEVNKKLEY